MPKHSDFQDIYNNFVKKYGQKKGESFYYAWLNKHKLDDTKSMPKHLKGETEMEDFEGKVLTTEERKHLPERVFAIPEKRGYPIHDLVHARNALARVAAFGSPEEKKRVRAAVYRRYPELKPSKEEAELKTFDITYDAQIDDFKIVAEEVTENGEIVKREKVILSGTLMDDEPNKNHWKADRNSFSTYAEDVSKIPVKIQHSESDWEILGGGIVGQIEGNKIKYMAEILNPKAVEKFKTGEWNAKFMGVSPRISGYDKAECNICAEDVRQCKHIWGQKYEGQLCVVTPKGGHVAEMSLTSTPAYAPRAGTIDSISFAASLKEQLEELKIKGEQMTENTEFEKQIEDLSAQLKTKEEKITEYEAKLKEVSSSLEQVKKDNDTLRAEVGKFKAEIRKAELTKLIGDETIIASIIKKEMTDEEFKAELDILEKVSSVKTGGSLPLEGNKAPESDFKANWGFDSVEQAVKSFY